MSDQVVPSEDLGIGKGGVQLRGKKFGLLTPVMVVEKTRLGNKWLCECECGRAAIRSVASLRKSISAGREPMCTDCLSELNGGQRALFRSERIEFFKSLYEDKGTLYTNQADKKMQEDIVNECAAVLGFRPKRKPRRCDSFVDSYEKSPVPPSPLWRILAPEGHFFECCDCGRPFVVGFGCVDCVDPVCSYCVAREQHRCCPRVMTLQEVGDLFKLSRERIRGMQEQAIGGMRWGLEILENRRHCGVLWQITDDGIIYCRKCGSVLKMGVKNRWLLRL